MTRDEHLRSSAASLVARAKARAASELARDGPAPLLLHDYGYLGLGSPVSTPGGAEATGGRGALR